MTDAELRATAVDWLHAGRAACVVEVVRHRGSVPRPAGTRMLVGADAVAGTVGGGHLEWQAVARARQALAGAREIGGAGAATAGPSWARPAEGPVAWPVAWPVEWPVALGPSLGQCCGGTLVLRFTTLDAAALLAWPDPKPRFTLQLYGAGHVGRAIVRLLADIDCRVQWIDERDSEFPPQPPPVHVERLCVDPVEAEVDAAAPGSCYLVLTHSHDLDLRITEAVLRRGDFRYLGLIGSATKRARFVHRLEARGVSAAALARLTCPIGLPGVAGKAPAEIAVAVVAQLLAQA